MARSPATWPNPSRKMMDLLDERGPSPCAIEVDAWVEGVEFVVRADLPGIDPDRDLSLRVTGGRLLIAGERRDDLGARGRHERRRGRFAREVSLPQATPGGGAASYVDGVLEVRIPLAAHPIPLAAHPPTTPATPATTVLAVRHPVHLGTGRRGQPQPARRPVVRSGSAGQGSP